MKKIGIICEGERDKDMIMATIDHFLNEDIHYLLIQPEPIFGADNGAGWKGVIRWCQKYSGMLYDYVNGVTPPIDLLIIQMDADVARSEKEIFCYNVITNCQGQGTEDPLNCSIAKEGLCSQILPPNSVCSGEPEDRVRYLRTVLNHYLDTDQRVNYIVTIPCDATDTWILAAFEDEYCDVEKIKYPWGIIAKRKDYHGIRIPGKKKAKKTYGLLIERVCEKWDVVKEKCPQALQFENEIRNHIYL
ncbi:MAG: hypothetical protein IJ192_08950 [Clostridia bacterium]|nr:hypothetical protein [Clostridia bacterium]